MKIVVIKKNASWIVLVRGKSPIDVIFLKREIKKERGRRQSLSGGLGRKGAKGGRLQ